MSSIRHFLDIHSTSKKDLEIIFTDAVTVKASRMNNQPSLNGKTLIMIFEKPSTRTRLSFEIAMIEEGGHAVFINRHNMQLHRGETLADTAHVISRFAHCIMIRTHAHNNLHELASNAHIPVINGLTDLTHPCQILADIMTIKEINKTIQGQKIAWIGDGNNVANSWIEAAAYFPFELVISCPKGYEADAHIYERAIKQGASIEYNYDPHDAAQNADVIVTDTWISMNDDEKDSNRQNAFMSYQVNDKLMKNAKKDAIFLHCLPAHRGEEVTSSVIDGPQSAVWQQAENRLHIQKAILRWCMHII